jgi:hypothetical protein
MKRVLMVLTIMVLSSMMTSCKTTDGRNPQMNNDSFTNFVPVWAETNFVPVCAATNGVSK